MENILTVKDLSIRIDQRVLMNQVSFSIGEGEAVLLSGTNGIGKSSLLKSILRLETDEKQIEGEIDIRGFGNVFGLSTAEIQKCRASVAYVPQKDEFQSMGNIKVRDVFSESLESSNQRTLNDSEVNDIIDKWIPRKSDGKRVFEAKSKPGKFSGGEQRLLSILSVISTRSNADLLLIDEPLNNLDYENARNISNLLNKVIRENPKMSLLMISHCRIFPFITREIRLDSEGVSEVTDSYVCHSCFGEPNQEGFYV